MSSVDFILFAVGIITVVVAYYKWMFQYWQRKNLPYLQPRIPYGNLTSPFRRKEHLGITMARFYQEMKRKQWKHGGIFFITSPTYFLVDLDYVKNVMSKDFQYFTDRGFYYNEEVDPLSAHLFALGGPKWRNLRTKLTPTFTSGKMKMMFQTLIDCEENLQEKMLAEYKKKTPIDIKEILGCFTTDIIGSCAFGLECNTFVEENSPFRVYGKEIFNSTKYRVIKATFSNSFPKLAESLKVTITPKYIQDFFMKVVKDTVNYREKNNYTRKDFMQLLIDLKNNKLAEEVGYKHDGKTLSIEELAAQCFVFFLAGFETSSTTMSFALYEMSKHQDIQEKVRKEIEEVLSNYGGKITYEAINDMKYMNQVIDETLRKYPPVSFLTRKCVKDYELPNEGIVIEKDTTVVIPVLGIHYDDEYYPDPQKFDPERFTEENKNKRHHFAHMPFGEGPRLCIGMRFGLMQTKVGLTSLLRKYRFTVNKKTQEPLKMQVNSFVLAVEGEIWLNAEKLSQE